MYALEIANSSPQNNLSNENAGFVAVLLACVFSLACTLVSYNWVLLNKQEQKTNRERAFQLRMDAMTTESKQLCHI